MKDLDIRRALRREMERQHADEVGTVLLDELSLCEGRARVDFAVINGEMCGFEIKSDRDTLTRLPEQVAVYGRVLDRVTLVVGFAHRERALELIPYWWGVMLARESTDGVRFECLREAQLNPNVDPHSVVQLLWREEALSALEGLRLEKGVRSKPRRQIWSVLASSLSVIELSDLVREKLKSRTAWREVGSRA